VVHSIDPDVEKRYLVEDFVAKAGLAHKVKLYSGLAQEVILNELSDQIFDLVFIDADKENYSLYYDLVIDQIRANGIILVDNVLWKGRVLEEKKDKKTAIIDAFNQKVKEDPRVSKILLPIRDGLFLIQKNG
jgi:predicted O-methyltransferase YrrM